MRDADDILSPIQELLHYQESLQSRLQYIETHIYFYLSSVLKNSGLDLERPRSSQS